MCPRCHAENCKFELLQSSCIYAYLTYLLDNHVTVVFAIVMSIWCKCSSTFNILILYFFKYFLDEATIFMELCKREEAILQLRWNLRNVAFDTSMRYKIVQIISNT